MSEKFDVWKVDYCVEENAIYVEKLVSEATTADLTNRWVEDGEVYYENSEASYSTCVFYPCREENKKEIGIAAIGISNISAFMLNRTGKSLSNFIEEHR